ncbi:hypothetical protein TRAPUB_7553 [Trametes pubescens]|uniref:Uncharacterized protein n=1 Tax=Trametes pubescens TaxID=154538 RepID=A0A1M2V336_TRAPU|nr:hypothetical protein TRAPUB_7553 [Trametes pubescens]
MPLKLLGFALTGVISLYTLVKGDTLLIDNTDPRVVYSATRVLVFGMLVNTTEHPIKALFTLDQRSPEGFEGPDNVSGPQYHVKFWESPSTDLFEHTLRVENNGDHFWLDYLEIVGANDETSTSSTSDAPSTPSTSDAPSSTGLFTSSSTGIAAPTPSLTSTLSSTSSTSQSSTAQTTSSTTIRSSSVGLVHTPSPSSAAITPNNPASHALSSSATRTTTTTETSPGNPAVQTLRAHAKELTSAQIAGIAVGALAIGHILVLAALWQCRRRRRCRSILNMVMPKSSPDNGERLGRVMEQRVQSSSSLLPEYSSRDSVSGTIDIRRRSNSDGMERRRARPVLTSTFVFGAATASAPQGDTDIVHWTETDGGIRLAGGRARNDIAGTVDPPPYRSSYGSRDGSLDLISVGPATITK